MIYRFIDNKGTFSVKNPHTISYLYFPLTNTQGSLLSCISPNLAGDIKRNNECFLTPPAGIEDIKNNPLVRRDFFLNVHSPKKRIIRLSQSKKSHLEAGLLYHKLTKIYTGIRADILNFIPHNLDAEIMRITITNTSGRPLVFSPTSFIPLYGGSERTIRDHRHVSSLLNRIQLTPFGIILQPSMVFDEKKHTKNTVCYYVMGYSQNAKPPAGQYPTLLSFCGEPGTLEHPAAIFGKAAPFTRNDTCFDGKESCAAFRFKKVRLAPRRSATFILVAGIADSKKDIQAVFNKLNTPQKVSRCLEETKAKWQALNSTVSFDFKDRAYNGWLRWVNFQPTLRKLFGCSFLPHFDYGKGGRGWRDIWQDTLSLLVVDEHDTKKLIVKNFKGVRIDGSNATIVTAGGSFISDRNRISRVWMDHGIWPYVALKEYIHRTGDIGILLKKTTYFFDHQLKRAKETYRGRLQADYLLRARDNVPVKASILEHLLVQHLVQFFNVGEHNLIRLENADWNDGLDMAYERGESAAFSSMYAHNLKDICALLAELQKHTAHVYLTSELLLLCDTLTTPVTYTSYKQKQKRLAEYFDCTTPSPSGKKKKVSLAKLIADLNAKADALIKTIQNTQWLRCGFFNGYYDNKSRAVEGRHKTKVRMMLASQVFPIMAGVATNGQIKKIWRSVQTYLKDRKLNGYRLNTDFETLYLDLGRSFGFAYGDKENGAFFSHMNVLLAFALYKRGFSREGHEVLSSCYHMATQDTAMIYPNLPEYFNLRGRGLYHYLTGSASWYTHTLLTQVLGIKGNFGNLIIEPKLLPQNFKNTSIEVITPFRKRLIRIRYQTKGASSGKGLLYGLFEGKKIVPREGRLCIPAKKLSKHRRSQLTVIIG